MEAVTLKWLGLNDEVMDKVSGPDGRYRCQLPWLGYVCAPCPVWSAPACVRRATEFDSPGGHSKPCRAGSYRRTRQSPGLSGAARHAGDEPSRSCARPQKKAWQGGGVREDAAE